MKKSASTLCVALFIRISFRFANALFRERSNRLRGFLSGNVMPVLCPPWRLFPCQLRPCFA
jgi:hypothetical protein